MDSTLGDRARPFPETSWTLIERCHDVGSVEQRGSLDVLIGKYWGPVYFYVSRYWTRNREEAKDLTQAFFLAFLERDFLDSVGEERGRFRTFVCTALKHFLTDQKRAARALKRRPVGGLVSLAEIDPEDHRVPSAPEGVEAEAAFLAEWKRAVVAAALDALRVEGQIRDRGLFVRLFAEYYLGREPGSRPTYRDLCDVHGVDYHRLKNGLTWARQRFAFHLRQEIADQVTSPEELDGEARALFGTDI